MSRSGRIALLGSTGSIGRSTLKVVERHRDRFEVVALAARRNAARLEEQSRMFEPDLVVLTEGEDDAPSGWRTGSEGLIEAATHPDVDIVVNAVVGAAGLEATLAALSAGKRLALANKESLVAGGDLVLGALREGTGELIPVDSEHSAILQCLPGGSEALHRLILTASGGPFRDHSPEELERVRPEDALRHPTWEMGPKITVDSATLVNKALEIIEAHHLFGLPYERLEAVIHPQSIIHSMVEFDDGSVLAQMGFPTMELPILYALVHPERVVDTATQRFDPVAAGALTFEPVDDDRFPAFRLGVEAGRTGGTAPAVFNAANEVAVAAFLDETLDFVEIPRVIERTLEESGSHPLESLAAVREADSEARARARRVIEELQ